ncbi:MAG TPA: DotU family type IV/VI secretion system protein [Bryobacteraceae bacterium]|nr:DotU family type IV/VI secretion system protein [Bryobacteraceae bacterium]
MPERYADTPPRVPSATDNPPPRVENLALLYQGVFTGIVRVQAGRQPIIDPNAFQRRMEDLLLEVEREAARAGYPREDIEEANYAVVAFLDETATCRGDAARQIQYIAPGAHAVRPERCCRRSPSLPLFSSIISSVSRFQRARVPGLRP